jgi:hypothetical protein
VDVSEFLPEGIKELMMSAESWPKYQEVMYGFRCVLADEFSDFGKVRIFIGGSDGNSFVGFSECGGRVILFRLWT